jgi:hypothetical protein
MRRLPSALLLAALLACTGSLRADEARALVQRAVKALGGDPDAPRHPATRSKVKGKYYTDIVPKEGATIEGEFLTGPGDRVKVSLQVSILGQQVQGIVVLDGKNSWRMLNGNLTDLSGDELESLQVSNHQDRVTSLTPLLADKGFTLSLLDQTKVDGRPARGVKVSYKGQPDTSLYFDNETGLLVKYAYRHKGPNDDKEVLRESILRDYREPDQVTSAQRALRDARIDTTPAALVAFLRKQTPDPATVKRARALIAQLGDDKFSIREKATTDLIALGAVALPLLKQAARDSDLEVARRAEQCLQQIGEQSNRTTVSAAVHLLALSKPDGAVEALLDYLPSADPDVAVGIRAALLALARRDGKPNPVLVRVLEDRDPVRRAAAAAALGKDGGAYLKEPGRRLYFRFPRQAMKFASYRDGKVQMELEVRDLQFFNAFEDKEFARPSSPAGESAPGLQGSP